MICYITSQPKIFEFFKIIHSVPKPPQYSSEWAITVGVTKDSNLGRFTNLLKEMKFIDSDMKTTDLWDELVADKKNAVQQGLRNAYSELFSLFGDPYNTGRKEEVSKWFRKKMSDKKPSTIDDAIKTFYSLCIVAEYQINNNATLEEINGASEGEKSIQKPHRITGKNQKTTLPEISINLQIVLPDNAKSETYDNIFSSIHKFIYNINGNEDEG